MQHPVCRRIRRTIATPIRAAGKIAKIATVHHIGNDHNVYACMIESGVVM